MKRRYARDLVHENIPQMRGGCRSNQMKMPWDNRAVLRVRYQSRGVIPLFKPITRVCPDANLNVAHPRIRKINIKTIEFNPQPVNSQLAGDNALRARARKGNQRPARIAINARTNQPARQLHRLLRRVLE